MVTIKDVAKLAGVSHGTASNVLNKKGNVSVMKIKLVEKAASELGYNINLQAKNLRTGTLNKVFVLIPIKIDDKYSTFLSVLKSVFERNNIDYELVISTSLAHINETVESLLNMSPISVICCGVCAIGDLNVEILKRNELFVVDLFAMGNEKDSNAVYVRHEKTLEYITQIYQSGRFERIHFISSDRSAMESLASQIANLNQRSFRKVLIKDDNILADLFKIVRKTNDKQLLITTSTKLSNMYFQICAWYGIENKAKVVTICEKQMIRNQLQTFIELDIESMAYELANAIVEGVIPKKIIGEVSLSCPKNKISINNKQTIKILTIESPMTEALKSLCVKYKLETNVSVEIDTLRYSELYQLVMNQSEQLKLYDLVRFDMAWLNSIDVEFLASLDGFSIVPKLQKLFSKTILSEYTQINGQTYATPLDISVQMLFYRRDLFEDINFQRQYYEATKSKLEIPKTFEEFDKITRFFAEALIFEEYKIYGHTSSSGNDIVTYSDFIPRYREKARNEQQSEILLLSAWKEYRASLSDTVENQSNHWIEVAENFATGKTAMEIIYSNYASTFLSDNSILNGAMIGVADIPGQVPLLGGGCLAVIANERVDVSVAFLEWLYTSEILNVLSLNGGFIMSKNNCNNYLIQTAYPWFENFEERVSKGTRLKNQKKQITFEDEQNVIKTIRNLSLLESL